MVQVPIDDGYALQPKILQTIAGPNSNVVKEAKAHGAAGLGMVPGRAHQGKSIVCLSLDNHLHTTNNSPGCEAGRVKRFWRGLRIRVQAAEGLARCPGHSHNML